MNRSKIKMYSQEIVLCICKVLSESDGDLAQGQLDLARLYENQRGSSSI